MFNDRQKEIPSIKVSNKDSHVYSLFHRMQSLPTLAGNSTALQETAFHHSVVQRMEIGSMESSDPHNFNDIKIYLYKRMKEDKCTSPEKENPAYDELDKIFNTLNKQRPLIWQEQELLLLLKEHFNLEAAKMRAGSLGGVWAKISLFINGQWIRDTQLYQGGEGTGSIDLFGDITEESKISERDAEVQAIYEANKVFPTIIKNTKQENITDLKILFTTNIGPCDGCKKRVEAFLQSLTSLLRKDLPIDVIFFYSGDQYRSVFRGSMETHYGYDSSTRISKSMNEKRGDY